ncbi:MAG TPA: tetratricopeptide repeat protein [Gemmataceae bacterium]|nr:tetratricopeptide repeat protein [Gemmataceae bacterium]
MQFHLSKISTTQQNRKFNMWNETDFKQLEKDIDSVRNSNTAGAAEAASTRTVGSFYQDNFDQRAVLTARLKELWNGGAIYSVSEGEDFSEFKRVLILWLENILASREKSHFASWKTASLEALADQTDSLYYAIDRTHFHEFPNAILQRCRLSIEQSPPNDAAWRILFNVSRTRFELAQHLSDACCLKELEDVAGMANSPWMGKIGHALISLLDHRLQKGMLKHSVSAEDLRANPMGAVEAAFGKGDGDAECHLVTGLLQAGYRGVAAGEVATYGILLGLREAYNFFLAGRQDLAVGSLRWAEYQINAIGDALPKAMWQAIGVLYLCAASGARQIGYFDSQIQLLERAKSYLPEEGDDHAECLLDLGQEYQRQGKPYEAIECYEEGLRTPNLTEPRLIGMLEGCLGRLLGEAEGDMLKMMAINPVALEAFGFDRKLVDVFPRIVTRMLSGSLISDGEHLEAINLLQALIVKWRGEDQSSDRVFSMYLLVLKLAMSIDDPACLPFAFTNVLQEADRYVAGAKPASVMEYNQLKATIHAMALPNLPALIVREFSQMLGLYSAELLKKPRAGKVGSMERK